MHIINIISLNFYQSTITHKNKHPFLTKKINWLISSLENLNVFLNWFFNSSLSLFDKFSLHDKHLYFNKLSLSHLYSRKQLQFLHLILWITSSRLSTRFDYEIAILSIFQISFYGNFIPFQSYLIINGLTIIW